MALCVSLDSQLQFCGEATSHAWASKRSSHRQHFKYFFKPPIALLYVIHRLTSASK